MKQTPVFKHIILGLLLVLSPLLFLTACNGEKETTPPAATPTPEAASPSPTSTFTFKNQFLSFEYGTGWRVSGSTENSIVLTRKERPGDVLLSAQWVEAQAAETGDLAQLYRNQLDLLSNEVQKLEDIKIDNINAVRYVSMVTRDEQESVVTMHIIFKSGETAYLITFSAGPDDFVSFTDGANQVINTIKVP